MRDSRRSISGDQMYDIENEWNINVKLLQQMLITTRINAALYLIDMDEIASILLGTITAFQWNCSVWLSLWSQKVDCCSASSPLPSSSFIFKSIVTLSLMCRGCDGQTVTWEVPHEPPVEWLICVARVRPRLPGRMDGAVVSKKMMFNLEKIAAASSVGLFSRGPASRVGQSHRPIRLSNIVVGVSEHHSRWPFAVRAAGTRWYLRYTRLTQNRVTN